MDTILFFEDEAGNQLPHHIRGYDPVTGNLDVTVQLPTWRPAAESLPVRMYYGNASVTVATQDVNATWDGEIAHWDCETGEDYSPNGYNLVPTGITSGTLIGDAGDYNGSAIATRGDSSFLEVLSGATFRGWVDPDAIGNDEGIFSQGIISGPDGNMGVVLRYDAAGFFGGSTNTVLFQVLTSDGATPRIEGETDNQTTDQQYIAGVFDSGEILRLFIDGRFVSASHAIDTGVGVTLDMQEGPINLGAGPKDTTSGGWNGLIDEFRIRGEALTATWLETEYNAEYRRTEWYGISSENTSGVTRYPVAASAHLTTTEENPVAVNVVSASFDPQADGVFVPTTIASTGNKPVGNNASYGFAIPGNRLGVYFEDGSVDSRDSWEKPYVAQGGESTSGNNIIVGGQTVGKLVGIGGDAAWRFGTYSDGALTATITPVTAGVPSTAPIHNSSDWTVGALTAQGLTRKTKPVDMVRSTEFGREFVQASWVTLDLPSALVDGITYAWFDDPSWTTVNYTHNPDTVINPCIHTNQHAYHIDEPKAAYFSWYRGEDESGNEQSTGFTNMAWGIAP